MSFVDFEWPVQDVADYIAIDHDDEPDFGADHDLDLDWLAPARGPVPAMPGFRSPSPPPQPQPQQQQQQRQQQPPDAPRHGQARRAPAAAARHVPGYSENEHGVIEIQDSDDDDDGIEFVGFGNRPAALPAAPRPQLVALPQQLPQPQLQPQPRAQRARRTHFLDNLLDRAPPPPHRDLDDLFGEPDADEWMADYDLPGPSRNRVRRANRNARAGDAAARHDRIFSPPPPAPQFHQIPPVPPIPPQIPQPQRPPPLNQGFFRFLGGGGPLNLLGHLWGPGNEDPAIPGLNDGLGNNARRGPALPVRPLGFGGAIFRNRNRDMFFGFGLPANVDVDGWERYDPAMFGEFDPPAAPLNPADKWKREWVFTRPARKDETTSLVEPEPRKKTPVIDLTDRKGKRKAVEIESDNDEAAPKRMFVCACCSEQLVGEAGQRGDDDRMYALRCGHVIDGRCVRKLAHDPNIEAAFAFSDGSATAPALASSSKRPAKRPPRGRGKKAQSQTPQEETLVLAEREWTCPAKGCERVHVSQYVQKVALGPGKTRTERKPQWVGKASLGPIGIFA